VRKLKSENLYAAVSLLAAGAMPRLEDDKLSPNSARTKMKLKIQNKNPYYLSTYS